MTEAQMRRELQGLFRDALETHGVRTHLDRSGVLFWSPGNGELGWSDALIYHRHAEVWRIHVCYYDQKISAQTAFKIGLLPAPRWGPSGPRGRTGNWRHRKKIEFSFMPEEFDLVMSRWLAEMVFSEEGEPAALPDFLARRWGEMTYLWTNSANEAMRAYE